MKKKISSVVLALVMLLTCILPITVSAADEYTGVKSITVLNEAGKTAKAGDVYSISNAEELLAFGKLSNTENKFFEDCTIILTADIDLNPGWLESSGTVPKTAWTPIKNFVGNFDGQGHTIRGLYFNITYAYAGFFACVQDNPAGAGLKSKSSVVIKNFTIENSYMKGKGSLGGLVGYVGQKDRAAQNTLISNVVMDVHLQTANKKTGGFLGEFGGPSDATITFDRCVYKGFLDTDYSITGGFIGVCWRRATFKDCAFTGKVHGWVSVGGYIGSTNSSLALYPMRFERCISYGEVHSFQKGTAVTSGGYIGDQYNVSEFVDCVNLSKVTNAYDDGVCSGFVAWHAPQAFSGSFTRCLNFGTTTNKNAYYTNNFVGKFAPVADNPTAREIAFTDCYYNAVEGAMGRAVGFYFNTPGTGIIHFKDTAANIDVLAKYADLKSGEAGKVEWGNYTALNKAFFDNSRKPVAELTGIAAVANLKAYDFVNTWEIHSELGVPVPKVAYEVAKLSTAAKKTGVDLLGVQEKAVENGKFAVRFVATVDSLEYTSVGFDIKVAYNGQVGAYKTATTNTVYDSLIAGGYKADFSVPESKLCAQRIENIPATGTVIFEVNSFSVQGAGAEAKVTADDAYVFVYQDGAFVTSYIK